jgi:uncharacterized protein YyaL (SSP411 family)
MAAGYRVLGDERYRAAAERAADFVLTILRRDGRLLRSYRGGQARLNGYLDDYAFMAVALIDLHEATGEERWRVEAERLVESMNEQFWDQQQGGYFFTSHDHEALIARMKSNEDGAIPSGNSMAALALVRLGRLTGRSDYLQRAGLVLSSYAEMMRRAPAAFANMLLAADEYGEGVGRRVSVVVDSDPTPDTRRPTPFQRLPIDRRRPLGQRLVRVTSGDRPRGDC